MSEIIDRPGFFARLRTGTQRCLHCIIPYLNRPKPKDDDASIDAGKPSSTIADMSSVATSEELGDLFDMDTSIKKLPFFDTPLIKNLPAVETVTRDVRFYDGTSIIELPSIGATLHNFYGIHGLTPPDVSPTNDTYTSNTGHGNRQWH
ncbi:uncharacterized protein LOC106871839 isoform X2 [Octopus bimaculoides]|uniref:uncharacterized protein LOC106871839 isoform X2 n=1 Tax=Octopus bimaculoides TaxID=37653 RepID=UPI00071C7228|nr:uncharacterized protein LOC106871839 isoform X2 [Octopus bimaculoides]|eukprot:XP_014774043.1 PREDICTED: uncharacterized protein LOC106871839 isoform X2 [Octopus bimaculoides]